MNIPNKRVLLSGVALILCAVSIDLAAQDKLLDSCYSNAKSVNTDEEIFWSDLRPCDQIILQFEALDLSAHQQSSVLLNRAILLMELTEYTRARRDLEAALLVSPESEYLYLNLGVLDMLQGEYSLAIGDLTQALEINEFYADALFNRALAHNYAEDIVSAVDDLFTLQLEHPQEYLAWVTEDSLPTLASLLPELIIPEEPVTLEFERLEDTAPEQSLETRLPESFN